MNLKNSGDSTGFEPMTSAMPVQCSNQGMSYKERFLSYDIPFTGKHEPNKLTCSQLCDFGWLEHCTAIAEVMGLNPVESPEFFRFMRQLLKLSSKCDDHIFI